MLHSTFAIVVFVVLVFILAGLLGVFVHPIFFAILLLLLLLIFLH